MQLDPYINNHEIKAASSHDWPLLVALSLEEHKALKKDIIKLWLKHKALWSGRLGTINPTHHTINLIKGTNPAYPYPYRTGQRSLVMLREHIYKQLNTCVVKPAQSEWESPISLILRKDDTL